MQDIIRIWGVNYPFFTIGKILTIVLHVIDEYKVLTCCQNLSKIGNVIQFAVCSQINMVSVKTLGLAGSCTFSIGLISYTLGFPSMLKSQVKSVSSDWYIISSICQALFEILKSELWERYFFQYWITTNLAWSCEYFHNKIFSN